MAIYHLSAATVSGSKSAEAKADYCGRVSRYTQGRDQIVYLASGNMPSWATSRARSNRAQAAASAYWRAADRHERKNGRRAKHVRVALPRELSLDDQVELARSFAAELAATVDGPLPYTVAVDAGSGHNPHADILISERVNDGHERDPELWFRRAAAQRAGGRVPDPAEGGAPKSRALKPKQWLEQTRERWAKRCNAALAAAGDAQRVDHRSYARRGELRVPGVHIGPGSPDRCATRRELHNALAAGDTEALMSLQDRFALDQLSGVGGGTFRRVAREYRRVGEDLYGDAQPAEAGEGERERATADSAPSTAAPQAPAERTVDGPHIQDAEGQPPAPTGAGGMPSGERSQEQTMDEITRKRAETALDKARQRFRASASKEQIVDEVTKKRAEGALEALRPESRAVLLDASQRDFEAAVGRYITWCEHYEHDPSDPEAAGEHVAALRELQWLHQAADRHDPVSGTDEEDDDGPRLR